MKLKIAAVVSISLMLALGAGLRHAKLELTQAQQLEPRVAEARTALIASIRKRAALQLEWIGNGGLGNTEESSRLAGSARLLMDVQPESLLSSDRLQTELADAIARRLVAGTVSAADAKKIEAWDMSAQRAREHYTSVVGEQARLLDAPLVSVAARLSGQTPPKAELFAADRVALQMRP